ncbi:MAG: hypothetical protein WDZ52_11725, partial [Pseudohongiellaceae bacterium]
VFTLNNLVFGILEGRCPNAPVAKLQLLLAELSENPNYTVSLADIVFFQALLQAATGDFADAARLATSSVRERPDVRVSLYQVNWLIRSGQLELARNTLQQLVNDFGPEIAASTEHSARLQFLSSRLQALMD